MKTIYCLLGGALALVPGSGRAQTQPDDRRQVTHEFSVYGRAGLSTLRYDLSGGDRKNGFGGGAGVGYVWFFRPSWGLQTGLEADFYRTRATLPDGTEFRSLFGRSDDGEYTSDLFVSRTAGFEERQRAAYLAVPLMIQYRTRGKHVFYAAAGIKTGLRLASKYETTADLTNSMEFDRGGETSYMTDPDPDWCTGPYPNARYTGGSGLKFAALGAIEAGVKWRLSAGMQLYTGLYADIGLNSVKKVTEAQVLDYTEARETPERFVPASYRLTSLLASNERTGRVVPIAFGVKIGLAFGKAKRRSEPVPAPVATPAAAPVSAPDADSLRRVQEAEAARRSAEAQARRQAAEAARLEALAAEARTAAVAQLLEPLDGFGFDVFALDAAQQKRLDAKAEILNNYPDLHLILTGHTCDYGPAAYNLRLGERRAEAVRHYLVERGVAAERLRLDSRGKEQPCVPNTGRESRLRNRRVEFIAAER